MVDGPFRGSQAVADGLLTANHLRGPRFLRLFPDIYVRVGSTPPDLRCLSRAAYLYVEGFGVLGGYSAASLLKIDCAPRGAGPEVVVERQVRCRTGLVVTRSHVPEADRRFAGGCIVTSPLLTAWHLARRLDLVDAVVALDAPARHHSPTDEPFPPSALLELREKRAGARGCGKLDQVVLLSDPRAGSPMETRLRLLLVFAGLRPEVQYTVRDRLGRMRFDLAFPEANWRSSTTAAATWSPVTATGVATCVPARSAGTRCASTPPVCWTPPTRPFTSSETSACTASACCRTQHSDARVQPERGGGTIEPPTCCGRCRGGVLVCRAWASCGQRTRNHAMQARPAAMQ